MKQTNNPLGEQELHSLRHMLGWNARDLKEPPEGRNSYCAEPGDKDMARLETLGLVTCTRRANQPGVFAGSDCFVATDLGKATARRSFYERRQKKSSRVYSAWLSLADCWPDWKFGDFVKCKDPEIVAIRRNA